MRCWPRVGVGIRHRVVASLQVGMVRVTRNQDVSVSLRFVVLRRNPWSDSEARYLAAIDHSAVFPKKRINRGNARSRIRCLVDIGASHDLATLV